MRGAARPHLRQVGAHALDELPALGPRQRRQQLRDERRAAVLGIVLGAGQVQVPRARRLVGLRAAGRLRGVHGCCGAQRQRVRDSGARFKRR